MNNIQAWLWVLGVLLGIIVIAVLLFNFLILILPIIIIAGIIGYLWKLLHKSKKEEVVDVKFKVKK